jgi:hypothetical protein
MSAVVDEARASAHDMVNATLRNFSSVKMPGSIEIEDEEGNAVRFVLRKTWLQ